MSRNTTPASAPGGSRTPNLLIRGNPALNAVLDHGIRTSGERGSAIVIRCRVSSDRAPDQLEQRLRERLDALGPAPRGELLHVLTLPEFDRVGAIQSYWGNPKTRPFRELLIDCEEDRTLRAVLVGMLREDESR